MDTTRLSFDHDHGFEKKLLRILFIIQFLFLLTAVILLNLPQPPFLIILSIAILSLIFLIIGFLLIYHHYTSLPYVKDKRNLTATHRQVSASIEETQSHLSQAQQKHQHVDQEHTSSLEELTSKHNQEIADLDRDSSQSINAENLAIASILRQVQNDFIESGLKSKSIYDSDIEGVGLSVFYLA